LLTFVPAGEYLGFDDIGGLAPSHCGIFVKFLNRLYIYYIYMYVYL